METGIVIAPIFPPLVYILAFFFFFSLAAEENRKLFAHYSWVFIFGWETILIASSASPRG